MSGGRLLLALAAALAVGFGAGAWYGQRADPDGGGPPAAPGTSAPTPERVSGAGASPRPAPPGPGEQRSRALRDPAFLQQLLQRYATEAEEDERGALLALLRGVGNDDVLRFALALAGSGEAEARRRGLALLEAFPLDRPDVRDTVALGLQAERDPAVLQRYVELAAPAVMPVEDAAPLVRGLEALTAHPDPEIRGRSVVQFAQWSDPAAAEEALGRALIDQAPEVRRAAVGGIVATRARSDRLKDGLLWMASDAATTAEDRAAAVFALQWFALDRDEYALYRQAAAQADAAGDGH
ncbi:HEAT repeat domain-containing protein [Luteimonas sp. RD2P54]|uniref:HEAT repeat domain-containing protein n=1 Tax=Luteimonas endophytica TaxID=3042023 RepID=A0ABT6J899_9GAMM|nr:HEAT repeat domain-containing protein [Luteimonas endophytica]MDH5823045.1 HEAT repeat domain-containing protein [Luteimonas endophytica]